MPRCYLGSGGTRTQHALSSDDTVTSFAFLLRQRSPDSTIPQASPRLSPCDLTLCIGYLVHIGRNKALSWLEKKGVDVDNEEDADTCYRYEHGTQSHVAAYPDIL